MRMNMAIGMADVTTAFLTTWSRTEELEKTLLVENPIPAVEIAARLKNKHQCEFPPEIIDAFKDRLINELENDPVTDPLLSAIKNSVLFRKITKILARHPQIPD